MVVALWVADALAQALAGSSPLFWSMDQVKWLVSGHGLCSAGEVAQADRLSVLELSQRNNDQMVGYTIERPAYFAVLNASLNYRRDADARQRLRERFGRAFQQKQPALTDEQALRLANVALQVVKSLNPLLSQAELAERAHLVAEFKLVLSGYLSSRLAIA